MNKVLGLSALFVCLVVPSLALADAGQAAYGLYAAKHKAAIASTPMAEAPKLLLAGRGGGVGGGSGPGGGNGHGGRGSGNGGGGTGSGAGGGTCG